MHYSQSTNAFYPDSLRIRYEKAGSWPEDAVEVTADQYATYSQGQAPSGMQRGSDNEGRPTWVLIPPESLENLASKKRGEIDSAAARAVADIRSLYPDFERETWGDQEDEARAWTADNTTPTPTLTGIAEARRVTVDYLAPKVIKKADQYRALATSVAGKRQRLEDDIAAALKVEDREGLEAIEWSNAE